MDLGVGLCEGSWLQVCSWWEWYMSIGLGEGNGKNYRACDMNLNRNRERIILDSYCFSA
jgi:hypothetical protein